MKLQQNARLRSLALVLIAAALPVLAEDIVTIPKSRLDELLRKEAELAKLKGELSKALGQDTQAQAQPETNIAKTAVTPPAEPAKTQPPEIQGNGAEVERLKAELSKAKEENAELQKQREADAKRVASATAAEQVLVHASPPMASLPPLKDGETVDAVDLANHYRADAAAADRRYRKRTFVVRGEVAGFQQPMFVRDYEIILKTPDREMRVVCRAVPPEEYKAVFSIKNGSKLVGLTSREARVPITKVGDIVAVEGRCKGIHDSTVEMTGCQLRPIP
jgi:hypothetical protein